jgi:hypothetical protein
MKVFWDGNAPSLDELRDYLLPDSDCPLNEIIYGPENEGNMRTLRDFAFTALKRNSHSCRGCNFGIFASSGQGKTYIVKQFAKTVKIPLIFVQSTVLTDTSMLFRLICEEFERFNTRIVPYKNNRADFVLPPCIVFFDEAHALNRKLMQGGLLNAMEIDDGYMQIRHGRSASYLVNCKEVCWIGATTEKGKLFDAFLNRLGVALEWQSAGPRELAKIVKLKLDQRSDIHSIPLEVCKIVARYQQVPREAINFAVRMIQRKNMTPVSSWEEIAEQIATDMGLDPWGFTEKQLMILKALGNRPIAENRLATICKCRIEQVQKYELPRLMDYSNGGPLVVSLGGRGLCITKAGLSQLDKRLISHKGYQVCAEHFEEN